MDNPLAIFGGFRTFDNTSGLITSTGTIFNCLFGGGLLSDAADRGTSNRLSILRDVD